MFYISLPCASAQRQLSQTSHVEMEEQTLSTLHYKMQNVYSFSPFFMSARFLDVLPSVCHLFYCSPCTAGGGDESPAGLVFTLIRPPSRISILLFVYRILRVVLNMLHCLVIYIWFVYWLGVTW